MDNNTQHPTEPILEAILQNQDENAKSQEKVLEAILQTIDSTDPEPLLGAQLVQSKKNADNIVNAVKEAKVTITIDGADTATYQGGKGDKGEKGDKGDKGDRGEKGEMGEKGLDGKDGFDGLRGTDGLDGKDGVDGKDGIDGKDGKNGAKGDKGDKGEPGKDGKSISQDIVKQFEKKIKDTESNLLWVNNGAVKSIVAGTNVTVTGDPLNPIISSTGGGTVGPGTANEIAYFDSTTTVNSLTTAIYPSLVELAYVKGVTSAIQTQINAKAPSTAPTFATSITGSYLTASQLLGTDGSKNIVSLSTATYPSLTELSYVKGVTSAIQTQLTARLPLAGGTMTGSLINTVANTANYVPITLTQNDTTNNPRIISVTNAGTGNSIYIDANGNTGTAASTSGAFLLDNTGNTGAGANFYTNGTTVGSMGVLFAKVDHASASGPVVRFDNDGTGNTLQINANGNVGTSDSTSGALLITNTNNTGYALNIYSNAGASAGALVKMSNANAAYNQAILQLTQTSTSGAATNIRLDGPSPQIEFVETDQVGTDGSGKFEVGVNGDIFYISGRNSTNTSFEDTFKVDRLANGGGIRLFGTTSGYTKLVSPATGSSGVVTLPSSTSTLAISSAAQTFTGTQTFSQIVTTNNAITASGNAATVPITSRISTVTNNSAATLTITITTTSAVDGMMVIVRVLDSSAAAQTITWVNTENSTVTAPTTSNGSTTLPLTVGFQYNSATSKWRCIASA